MDHLYDGQALIDQRIDEIARAARRARKGPGRALAEAFARAYYGGVPYQDIGARSADDLARQALSLLDFATRRKPGQAAVRVCNPDVETFGWACDHTVVEVVNDNMPFLVDSVAAALNARGFAVDLIIHPIVAVERDKAGALRAIGATGSGRPSVAPRESFIHVEIDRQATASEMAEIERAIGKVLADVRAAVDDWQPMRRKLAEIVEELSVRAAPPGAGREDLEEVRAFLKWLDEDHFTFLGYRRYAFKGGKRGKGASVVRGSGLGVLRDAAVRVFYADDSTQPRGGRRLLADDGVITIAKTSRRATVHRPVHMDTIGVTIAGRGGHPAGEHRFVGLFTSHAYSLSPLFIPLLRRKVSYAITRAGFDPKSHDGKALLHILETYPRDELFQIPPDELVKTALGILHLQERQRTALFVRRDPFGRYMSCLVFTPREVFSSSLRERFGEILSAAFDGSVAAFYTQLGDDPLARIHFIIRTDPARRVRYDLEAVESDLARAARSWSDDLRDAFIAARGESDGLALFRRYRRAFPSAYRETFPATAAVADADRAEAVLAAGRPGLDLYRREGAAAGELRLKIFQPGAPLPLSDALPMLENMGLRVIEEVPFKVSPRGAKPVWIHDFGLVRRHATGKAAAEFPRLKELFEEAFDRVRAGAADDDGFNQLVLGEGLAWREVMLIRAYSRYLRQARVPFSQDYMIETFVRNPGFARMLVDLFAAKFDPGNRTRAESRAVTIKVRYEEAVDRVRNLDEDRILRRFLNLVLATLRTNYHQTDADGALKAHLSLKLDSGEIEDLPLPRPWREIFVHSPRMEGIHLRGGPVARGGIRWSDRREDFRTEILGLMKAQMVKNPVIVPVGAKGGFVLRRPPAEGGREALRAEGVACYETLMRGLLDITDNRSGDRVIPPKAGVRHDGDDPYLVVAADKGTATFSDIANAIAREYGFWLDDAFASGGSVGYDHKRMGITARGAWESVKRHFREMGRDIQGEDFTVIGVGDMAGDVFGNGMLLSRHIRLVAAFNHMHVFLDPDPDPARSLKERRRLFRKPRSTWMDFDRKLISKGGGVFERSAKSVPLSPQARALLGISQTAMPPDELIRRILTAAADLLWFGGIGTFVKSSKESHAEVGDRANDAVRVDGRALRCKVVGEGANLAVTQAGRVEYARAGGCINTDAVDNSAGVDCSDHEVNIKILLGQLVAARKLTMEARDKLLAHMTEEVARLVLRDNYLQTEALSVAEAEAAERLPNAQRLIRALERAGRINRTVDGLPDEEHIQELAAARLGLTRPEMAVLLAHAKLALNDELLDSDLPDEKLLEKDLLAYFPTPIREAHAGAVCRHRLRREIIVTAITNQLVNRAGFTFVNDLKERSGLGAPAIARAFAIVRDAFACEPLWDGIEALDNKVEAALQTESLCEVKRLMERAVPWFLDHGDHPLDIAANVDCFRPGIEALEKALPEVVAEADQARLTERRERFTKAGMPVALARRLAGLPLIRVAPDIVSVADADARAVPAMARTYFGIGDRFGFDWLRAAARRFEAQTPWQRQAVMAMVDELYTLQHDLVTGVLAASDKSRAAEDPVMAWAGGRKAEVARTAQVIADLQAAGSVDIAMLAVAVRQLRRLVAG